MHIYTYTYQDPPNKVNLDSRSHRFYGFGFLGLGLYSLGVLGLPTDSSLIRVCLMVLHVFSSDGLLLA